MANSQANVVATRYVTEAVKATGTLTFALLPIANDTITVAGTAFTFVASASTNVQITIGADIPASVENATTVLNASPVVAVAAATYSYNGYNGTDSVLTLSHDATGTAGNSFTIAGSVATASAGTLAGGSGSIGTTPTSALTELRANNPDFNANISTTTSQELRSDRNVTDLVRTTGASEGSIGFELTSVEYDSLIESALGGEFSPLLAISATTISAAAADNSINDSANGFSTTDILPGMFIRIGGFTGGGVTANNGIAKVVSITKAKIVVSRLTLIDDAAGETVTIKGKSVRNAAFKKSFTIEREFTDVTQFMSHVGMIVSGMTLNAASEAIVEGSFNFSGRASTVAQATVGNPTTPIPATANPIMSAVANVGAIYENDTLVPSSTIAFKSINLTTNNNTRNLTAIGDLYPIDINLGSFNAEFAVEAYFSNTTLLSKYLDGTATELSYTFTDDSGNSIVIDAPQVKYSAGSLTGVTLNSEVMQSLTGTVLYDPVSLYALQLSYLPA